MQQEPDLLGGLCYAIPVIGGVVSASITSGLTTIGQMAVSGGKYDVVDYLIMGCASAFFSGMTAGLFGGVSNNLSFFKDTNYILEHFIEFATDSGGITLMPRVLVQAAAQIAIRESAAGFVATPLNNVPQYFDDVYNLHKSGLSTRDSFKYAI